MAKSSTSVRVCSVRRVSLMWSVGGMASPSRRRRRRRRMMRGKRGLVRVVRHVLAAVAAAAPFGVEQLRRDGSELLAAVFLRVLGQDADHARDHLDVLGVEIVG